MKTEIINESLIARVNLGTQKAERIIIELPTAKSLDESVAKIIEDTYHLPKWYKLHKRRIIKRLIKYKITWMHFECMLRRQNNCCAGCGKLFTSIKQINVDHDHKTGKVRFLLCSRCNITLGFVESIGFAILYERFLFLLDWHTKNAFDHIDEKTYRHIMGIDSQDITNDVVIKL